VTVVDVDVDADEDADDDDDAAAADDAEVIVEGLIPRAEPKVVGA
jgi:hypothetical protein